MFTQAIGATDRFDHLANDELAVIRETALNKLQELRHCGSSTRSTACFSDLEFEAKLIEDELAVRKYPKHFQGIGRR